MSKQPRPRRSKRARRSAREIRKAREIEWDRAREARAARRAARLGLQHYEREWRESCEARRDQHPCWGRPPAIEGWSRPKLRSYLWGAWEGRCHYCGIDTYLYSPGDDQATIDHSTPTSRGGPHDIVNLVLSCWRCNQIKGPLTAHEFFAYGLAEGVMALKKAQ